MPKPKTKLATIPADDAALHAARFVAMHDAARARGLQFKLFAYFAGLETTILRDIHAAQHGETRGRKKGGEENKCHGDIISLAAFLREKTGCSTRTAYRYADHYAATIATHPELAAKLNAQYEKAMSAAALGEGKADADGGALALALGGEGKGAMAKLLQTLAESPDAWGLDELFHAQDEEESADGEDAEDEGNARKLSPAVKFWALNVMRRMKADEFLRLPKPQLRALSAQFKEAAKKAEAALNAKPAKAAK